MYYERQAFDQENQRRKNDHPINNQIFLEEKYYKKDDNLK